MKLGTLTTKLQIQYYQFNVGFVCTLSSSCECFQCLSTLKCWNSLVYLLLTFPIFIQILISWQHAILTTVLKHFLARRSRRLEWAIVIAHRPTSVRKLFTFSTSSPEPLDGFWWNLVGMKYSWSLTSVVVFRPDPPRGGSRAGPK